ncbi:copper chaperone PCu(A)C [Campylobacter sp. faydin G-24]|uniref:Copper chaperone PCu(A)C n=1 Tax=Campylobacter anatolicus TaxID=2829105 RepID=A0ABS5HKJ6_9BACT|nr:copper chaperone PCu(A)C [Campylobacter anatolicus]MBR8464596.1 copper chaperone PCu(A)C [Campylobacter anatolicus]
MKKIIMSAIIATFGISALMASDISLDNVRARTTKPGSNNSAIFMDIKNKSNKDIKLLQAHSSVCANTEIHTHKMENGMMSMMQIDNINIAKNSETKLAPGGLHIMLINLNRPLNDGDKVDVELEFDNGEKIKLDDVKVTPNFK